MSAILLPDLTQQFPTKCGKISKLVQTVFFPRKKVRKFAQSGQPGVNVMITFFGHFRQYSPIFEILPKNVNFLEK
jgi:hypothetical protein